MTKEQIIQEVGKPILRPLELLQFIFLLTLVSSPFIFIWGTWDLAWKIGLTGFLGMLIVVPFYNFAKKIVKQSVEEGMDKIEKTGTKSRFQQKLEKCLKEQNGHD